MAVVHSIEYRIVPGWPAYRVGSDGSVWSRWNKGRPPGCSHGHIWKKLKPTINKKRGYACVMVSDEDHQRRLIPVHRLMLLAFVGPCPPEFEACHNDGNRLNNDITNLRWDSRQSNMKDNAKHGTIARGINHGIAKLDDEKVRVIRQRYATGNVSLGQLGDEYNVCGHTIYCVLHGYTWSHVK